MAWTSAVAAALLFSVACFSQCVAVGSSPAKHSVALEPDTHAQQAHEEGTSDSHAGERRPLLRREAQSLLEQVPGTESIRVNLSLVTQPIVVVVNMSTVTTDENGNAKVTSAVAQIPVKVPVQIQQAGGAPVPVPSGTLDGLDDPAPAPTPLPGVTVNSPLPPAPAVAPAIGAVHAHRQGHALVGFSLVVENIDYTLLTADQTLLDKFTAVLKQSVATLAQDGVQANRVKIAVSNGTASVWVQVGITTHRWGHAYRVKAALSKSVAALSDQVANAVAAVSGISEAATGAVSVNMGPVRLNWEPDANDSPNPLEDNSWKAKAPASAAAPTALPSADEGVTPTAYPTRWSSISFWMLVQNVEYTKLVGDANLLGSFAATVKATVAAEAGDPVLPSDITIAISAGSVVVKVTIVMPEGADADTVASALSTDTDLGSKTATNLAAAVALQPAITGKIHVSTGPVSVAAAAAPDTTTIKATWKTTKTTTTTTVTTTTTTSTTLAPTTTTTTTTVWNVLRSFGDLVKAASPSPPASKSAMPPPPPPLDASGMAKAEVAFANARKEQADMAAANQTDAAAAARAERNRRRMETYIRFLTVSAFVLGFGILPLTCLYFCCLRQYFVKQPPDEEGASAASGRQAREPLLEGGPADPAAAAVAAAAPAAAAPAAVAPPGAPPAAAEAGAPEGAPPQLPQPPPGPPTPLEQAAPVAEVPPSAQPAVEPPQAAPQQQAEPLPPAAAPAQLPPPPPPDAGEEGGEQHPAPAEGEGGAEPPTF